MLSTNRPLNLTPAEEALIIAIRNARYARITEIVVIEGQPHAVKLTALEQRFELSKPGVRNELLDLASRLHVPISVADAAVAEVPVATDSAENPEETDNSSENPAS